MTDEQFQELLEVIDKSNGTSLQDYLIEGLIVSAIATIVTLIITKSEKVISDKIQRHKLFKVSSMFLDPLNELNKELKDKKKDFKVSREYLSQVIEILRAIRKNFDFVLYATKINGSNDYFVETYIEDNIEIIEMILDNYTRIYDNYGDFLPYQYEDFEKPLKSDFQQALNVTGHFIDWFESEFNMFYKK